MQEGNTFP